MLVYLWFAEMYSGICLGNHPASCSRTFSRCEAPGGSVERTHNKHPTLMCSLQTTLHPVMNGSKKWVNIIMNHHAFLQAPSWWRLLMSATEKWPHSLLKHRWWMFHITGGKKVLVRKSKPAAPSGSLSCLYLRLSVPLCRAGQGSLVAFPGRHSRDGANHRFITAPQSDSQDLSLRSPSLLSQHAAARMLNCSLQHRRGLLQVCGFFFFLKSQIYEWSLPCVGSITRATAGPPEGSEGMWWAAAGVHRKHSEAVTNEAFSGEKLGVVDLQMSRSCNSGRVFTYNYPPPLAIWHSSCRSSSSSAAWRGVGGLMWSKITSPPDWALICL